MSKDKDSILNRASEAGVNRPDAGYAVPDGFFDGFADKFMANLPTRPEVEAPEQVEDEPQTLWMRMRPYVYMAAMFVGIWLMLQMFSMMMGSTDLQPMDTNPVIAEAFANEEFVLDYVYEDLSTIDILDEFYQDDTDMSFDTFDEFMNQSEDVDMTML